GLEQRRIGSQQDLAHGVGKAVVQPARHAVPEAAQAARVAAADCLSADRVALVAAADVLTAADVGGLAAFDVEVVSVQPPERAVTVERGLADHARLVDLAILERLVALDVCDLVTCD